MKKFMVFTDVEIKDFNNVINYLIKIDSSEFIRLALSSKFNCNKFHAVDDDHILAKIVNADDYYCSALIKLTREINKDFEEAAFKIVLTFDTDLINSLNNLHLTIDQKIDAYRAVYDNKLQAAATYLSRIKNIYNEYKMILAYK